MKKIINPWRNHEGYNCFGCSPDNPIGLHMEFYEDGDYIMSTWHPNTHYQGWVNTMHGGILSTLIDEVCGWVVTRKLQTSGYTVQLNVKFRKAVPTTEPGQQEADGDHEEADKPVRDQLGKDEGSLQYGRDVDLLDGPIR